MTQQNIVFPSFAGSPYPSPPRSNFQSQESSVSMARLVIDLPDSMIETSIQESSNIKEKGVHVKVFCRFRPGKQQCSMRHDSNMIDDGQNRYSFDHVFGKQATQLQIFSNIADRHIQSFFNGQNSTVFAFGQTGSGKTYTMFGVFGDEQKQGIIPRTVKKLFQRKKQQQITCSILQVYNEKLIDLFDPLKQSEGIHLKQGKNSVQLQGLVQVVVESSQQMIQLIQFGYRDRKIASTKSNDCSSRSHTLLFVYRTIRCGDRVYKNKLCFIDLAGSQKIRKSGAVGHTLEQTKKINLSLSSLGNVISALSSSAEHVPYRNSKLTRVLRDSLSGNCCTSLITTCSLDKGDYNQTLSTIRFAIRAKKIKNKRKLDITADSQQSPAQLIQSLKRELADTKKQLNYYKNKQLAESKHSLQLQDIPQEAVIKLPVKQGLSKGPSLHIRSVHLNSTSSFS